MAEKREVKCNGCGHSWLSGAKSENLRCRKCGSNESFSIPNDTADLQDGPTGAGTPNQFEIINRLKKRPVFMADAVRDERDKEFLNKEIGQRQYKGRLLRVTTVKEYEVSADGFWVTKFTIELKE